MHRPRQRRRRAGARPRRRRSARRHRGLWPSTCLRPPAQAPPGARPPRSPSERRSACEGRERIRSRRRAVVRRELSERRHPCGARGRPYHQGAGWRLARHGPRARSRRPQRWPIPSQTPAGGRPSMTVNLTRIYTKLGDGGETHLGDMSRVSKLHPRVEAYGTVDELNATVGVALLEPLPEIFTRWLSRIQNDLLDVGADLSVPPGAEGSDAAREAERPRLRVEPSYTEWLEQACDEVNSKLPPLRSFVIPGGSPAAASLPIRRKGWRGAGGP